MTDSNDSPPNSPSNRRRSSFAGQTFAELFGNGRTRSTTDNNTSNAPTGQMPGSISNAAANAQRRRMSVTSLGLSGSPQSSNFGFRRRDSISSANSTSIDESAVEDDGNPINGGGSSTAPTTPFARRVSFGARALRDVKTNGANGGQDKSNGRSPSTTATATSESGGASSGKKARVVDGPTSAKGRGDGYNWADNFRNRAERSASINSMTGTSPSAPSNHVRAKSIATPAAPPPEPPRSNVPDHFQERILKGDFYMD